MPSQGPPVCQGRIKVDDRTLGMCYMELLPDGTCKRQQKHASTEEIEGVVFEWGYTAACGEVLFLINSDLPLEQIKEYLEEQLGRA